jgi:dolichyl-phosphate beta-glucosyltransferase
VACRSVELSIVIPAYNEERRLAPTVREVLDYLSAQRRSAEVILVDDGSSDGTFALMRELAEADDRIRVIRLPRNRGKGYAVRTGVLSALGARILFADADGSTPIAELARLEARLDAGDVVAIGSRALKSPEAKVEALLARRVIGRIFHQLVRTLAVRGIVDTQCGFKLLTSGAAQAVFTRMRLDGFSFDVELLVIAQRHGYPVAEVPVRWTHRDGSKVNVVTDGLRMARDLFRIRANAVRGAYGRVPVRGEIVPAAPSGA